MTTRRSIPAVGNDLESHTQALQAIKEAVETGQRAKREILESYITVAEAIGLGLVALGGVALVNVVPAFLGAELLGSWTNFADTSSPAGYHKDLGGYVHLRGTMNVGGAADIFTLPEGYRPQFNYRSIAIANTSTALAINVGPEGLVSSVGSLAGITVVRLDGIVFAAYQ